jgi:hypothetical protein
MGVLGFVYKDGLKMARSVEEIFVRTAEIATAAGLTLLTTEWSGARAAYSFRCLNGQEFERRATAVLYKKATRCPECEHDAARERWMEIIRNVVANSLRASSRP